VGPTAALRVELCTDMCTAGGRKVVPTNPLHPLPEGV